MSLNQKPTITPVEFDPFAEGELLLMAPATESQKEIWASVQMGSDANCAYNESQKVWLRGQLNIDALRSALQELVLRHEALRTTFSQDGISLCIVASLNLEIPEIDLSELNFHERETELEYLLKQAVEQPFDLEHGPLFRTQIVKLQPQEHLIIITAHHIICDGWSWAVLMTDLGKLYSAFKKGQPLALEEPERFSDYAIAQGEAIGSEDAIATESFWLNQFSNSIPVLDFPTDRPRPPVRTFNAAREDWELSSKLVAELKQLGKTNGCSFMTTLLAGFEVWLYRLTGQEDLIVGVPAAGQAASGQYNLVGHCVNLLPLRSQIDPEQRFSDYLRLRRSPLLDAYDRQQFTFGNLLSKLAIPRDSSRIPLVPITFNLDQGLEGDKLPFAGLEVEFFSNPRTYENFELYVNATELKSKLILECQYNTNLFEAETIRRRLEELEVLLASIVANPDQTIATLPILTATERQWLAQWNQTQVPYPQDQSIPQLFEAQVEKTPDTVAVVFEREQLTYRALNERANQLAHYLQSLGVEPDVLVGICVERSLDMVVGLLGILKAGGAYVPLDPAYPQERLAFMLEDTQVSVLLTQQQLVEKLPHIPIHTVCLDTQWETITQENKENLTSSVIADNLAYVIYTSGSTGKPKGVSIPHRGVVRLVKGVDYANFSTTEVFLQLAPISFDASTFEIWGCLLNGARLVLFPTDKPSLEELAQIIERHQVTTLWLTAGLFNLMVDEQLEALKSMRQLLAGGDVLSVPHVQAFLQGVKTCQLINGYGPTESTTFTCCYPIEEPIPTDRPIPIGRPIANTQVYVLDKYLNPVPIGVPGELYIGGDGLARGYFNRPDLTEEKFIPNPLRDRLSMRLYKTGDIARYLSDGNLEFLGRIDNQVKIRGFRIELGEVESVLSQYTKVRESAVIVREDIPGDKRLVAYVVPTQEQATTTTDLHGFLKQKLPDYMVPATFVLLDRLPLTPNGKVDRKALPIPDATRPDLVATYVAPRTALEREIAEIWEQVLRLDRVGIYDNFFELGGHSLLGTQVMARFSKAFQIKLPLRTLFEVPTVAELAQRVETIRWAAQAPQFAKPDNISDYEEGEL
jgi:amino acid adenylation domain-containing protein